MVVTSATFIPRALTTDGSTNASTDIVSARFSVHARRRNRNEPEYSSHLAAKQCRNNGGQTIALILPNLCTRDTKIQSPHASAISQLQLPEAEVQRDAANDIREFADNRSPIDTRNECVARKARLNTFPEQRRSSIFVS